MSDPIAERAQQHQAAGYTFFHAFELAAFETQVDQWPNAWGDHLEALVFGDFKPPDQTLTFDRLGISIQPENLQTTVIGSAMTVLRARVAVSEKSIAAVKDAAARLNLLVGILSYANQGAPIRWWCVLLRQSGGGVLFKLGEHDPSGMLALIDLLPSEVRKRFTAALYWLRAPRHMLREYGRGDNFAVYAGYWNAFECLVDAAELLIRRPRPSRPAKQKAIRARLEKAAGFPGPEDIAALYHEVVDPGLRPKAEWALRLCASDNAEHFIAECFNDTPTRRGLYAIRNAINHGSIDVDDPETAVLIEGRFPELFLVVFSLLGGVLHLNLQLRTAAASPSGPAQQ